MPSVVDICNLALGHFGDKAEVTGISPPDGTSQAAHCARFYPIALKELLEAHHWGFAERTLALADVGDPPSGWLFRYKIPNLYIKGIEVNEVGNEIPIPWKEAGDDIHGRVILTDAYQAVLTFTSLVEDTTVFRPKFVTALSWLLASYLSGPITRKPQIAQMALERYEAVALPKAIMEDANSQQATRQPEQRLKNYMPPSMLARRS